MHNIIEPAQFEMCQKVKSVAESINTTTKATMHVMADPGVGYNTASLNGLVYVAQGDDPVFKPSKTYGRGIITGTPLSSGTFLAEGKPNSFYLTDQKGFRTAQPAAALLLKYATELDVDTTDLAGEANGGVDALTVGAVEVLWRAWSFLNTIPDGISINPNELAREIQVSESTAREIFFRMKTNGFMEPTPGATRRRSTHSIYERTDEIDIDAGSNFLEIRVLQAINAQQSAFIDPRELSVRLGYAKSNTDMSKIIADILVRTKDAGMLQVVVDEQYYIDLHALTGRGATVGKTMLGLYDFIADPDGPLLTEAKTAVNTLRNDTSIMRKAFERANFHSRGQHAQRVLEKRLIEAINQNPGQPTASVATQLGISSKRTHNILKRLLSGENPNIGCAKVGRSNFWYPSGARQLTLELPR